MGSNRFLYNQLKDSDNLYRNISNLSLDDFYLDNLSDSFEIRYYQEEAFKYFKSYFENFRNQTNSVLFNMATGSGKTYIMAGIILYLFSKGYNNFLFFVNSTNIISKTKDNFLNPSSDKYLFADKINILGNIVNINSVNTFEGVSEKDINICFTTIQKLHLDLNEPKENCLTFDDFNDKKIVFIADEAHHIQVSTKSEEATEKNWENTINRLLNCNSKNILLEFTATVGIENDSKIREKYLNKLLYKYDLRQYIQDKYSKVIEIFKVDDNKENLMLTAVLINQYRQDIAYKYDINHFKPIILFKTTGKISDSQKNREEFESLIGNLSIDKLDYIKMNSNNEIIQNLFNFYEDENITLSDLVRKIKLNFNSNYILDANRDEEVNDYQLVLNSLESVNNPIRIIFAVQKLNEGWDVLNLFDIVRLSNKSGNPKKPSKSTISEAQLIGRGARYYPFLLKDYEFKYENKFKRKFDDDLNNELRILEELYFYSFNDSKYISELRTAMVQEGLSEDLFVKKDLKLKDSFKNTDFYDSGIIYKNELKKSKSYFKGKSLQDLKSGDLLFNYEIKSGLSYKKNVFNVSINDTIGEIKTKEVYLCDIEKHIIKNAIAKNKFYEFNNLQKYFKNLDSINTFIHDDKYLNSLLIKFKGVSEDLINISNKNKFEAVCSLLNDLEILIKNNSNEFKGSSDFKEFFIKDIFHDKELCLDFQSNKLNHDGDIIFLSDKEWYVFDTNYGTSEEKSFVDFIDEIIDKLKKKFDEVYLIRNELHFSIYDFDDGKAFAPDFVLFLKKGSKIIQFFIEPKGKHLIEHDKWKEDFLRKISKKETLVKLDDSEYHYIYGVSFYNSDNQNAFKEELFDKINNIIIQ